MSNEQTRLGIWDKIMPEENALEIGGHCDITESAIDALSTEILLLHANMIILAQKLGEDQARTETVNAMRKLCERFISDGTNMPGPGQVVR